MYFLTLPVIFEHTSLLTPIALLFIFLTVLGLLYVTVPYPDPVEGKQTTLYQDKDFPFLYQAWYGNIPLWQVFWPYFIAVNLVLYSSDRAIRETFLSVPTWDNILLICIVTAIWWSVGIWRMSAHCHYRLYSATARAVAVALFSDFILRIFIRIKYPRVFFDCDGMLFDYSSCF